MCIRDSGSTESCEFGSQQIGKKSLCLLWTEAAKRDVFIWLEGVAETKFRYFTVFYLFPCFISSAISPLSYVAFAYAEQDLGLFLGMITVLHP